MLQAFNIDECQAPSDYPEFAEFLLRDGIDSISINPDSVMKITLNVLETEKALSK
jgi:pyruvate,water dikinase